MWINDDYTFKTFLDENHNEPIWLGYKKKLSNYIVWNFLIYIPKTHYEEFKEKVMNQKRNIYSDRFFTRLHFEGFLKLRNKSATNEISHQSAVLRAVRSGYTLKPKDKIISKKIDNLI